MEDLIREDLEKDLEDLDNEMPREYRLAHEHIDWFLATLRPLLMSHFIHGYKHGVEDTIEKEGKDE